MLILRLVILAYVLLELLNVIVLYFAPNRKLMNGLGIFEAWEISKEDEGVHHFTQFLANRLAGTKLLLIILLVVIVWNGDETLLMVSGFGIALSLASMFWRLFPRIRQMEADGQIAVKNYSTILVVLIGVFIFALFSSTLFALFS